jgi:hypothetical protein
VGVGHLDVEPWYRWMWGEIAAGEDSEGAPEEAALG